MPDLAINRPLLALAGLVGAAGVTMAAAGTHSSAGPDLGIAATFLSLHAPALIGISLLPKQRWSTLAGIIMVVGLVLFCGDLAMRGALDKGWFPIAAPVGGVALVASWILVIVSAFVADTPVAHATTTASARPAVQH
jgi:uncharacterized membrane protein YgdD (TMEM256/DUF423 family)